MRHALATSTLLLVIVTTAIALPAGAQIEVDDPLPLTSCSFTPSALTLGPGESGLVTLTAEPTSAEAISVLAFDGTALTDDSESVESGTESTVTYASIVQLVRDTTGETVTSGVAVQSLAILVGEGTRLETLCSLTITLVGEPEPTSTTTVAPGPSPDPGPATPDPEMATPRYTG